jgi:hypothetical protein
LDALDNSDLAFYPGGQNMTPGALCREIGEIGLRNKQWSVSQAVIDLTADIPLA